jgi:hypothetical protein
MASTRRLTAILAADVAGYSRLMEADEEGTHERLKAHFEQLIVLPFANLSDDREQQYFADAITEDLTTDLSRIAGSFVISRNTAFTYRGKPVDTLTPNISFGLDSTWIDRTGRGSPSATGFDTTHLSLKGLLFRDDPHEMLVSAGFSWGPPGLADRRLDARGSIA